MTYDHIISPAAVLDKERFHLSCGFHDTTSFLFEAHGFSVVIHCNGTFTFSSADGHPLETRKLKPMTDGRECYMDVLITTTDENVRFQLPEYSWIDHYPHCDGESDRWDAKIVGIRDEIVFPKK